MALNKPARDEVLTPKQVCEQYEIFGNPAALADRRWRGTGPAYIKTSSARSGRVFYRRSSIEHWLDSQTIAA